MKNKRLIFTICALLISSALYASTITFGGGYTKVSLQDGNHSVLLTDKAYANTEDIKLSADSIELSGDDYDILRCAGNVVVQEESKGIKLQCPKLVFNRTDEELMADGWIEIDDIEHEVRLSCAWLDYKQKESKMFLQIRAKIVKDTDNGLMTCSADSIEYDSEAQTVTMKGNASVVWGEDQYRAAVITVNLETEEVTLHGSISGEVNGK